MKKVTALLLLLSTTIAYSADDSHHKEKDSKKTTASSPATLEAQRLQAQIEFIMQYAKEIGIDDQDYEGNTALHCAIMSDNKPIADALIAAGASQTIKNNDGKTYTDLVEEKSHR